MLPVLRANPWIGAERKKILVQNASQIAGNGPSQAYLQHINRENTSNLVKKKMLKGEAAAPSPHPLATRLLSGYFKLHLNIPDVIVHV